MPSTGNPARITDNCFGVSYPISPCRNQPPNRAFQLPRPRKLSLSQSFLSDLAIAFSKRTSYSALSPKSHSLLREVPKGTPLYAHRDSLSMTDASYQVVHVRFRKRLRDLHCSRNFVMSMAFAPSHQCSSRVACRKPA